MQIRRLSNRITADPRKVILRRRGLGGSLEDFIDKFKKLSPRTVENEWSSTRALFSQRHRDFEDRLTAIAKAVIKETGFETESQTHKYLLGAYLAMEYSIEAAALFNPSIVPHFDQTGTAPDQYKFILSLRAVGEGHISSIEFAEGIYEGGDAVKLIEHNNWRTPATITQRDQDKYTASFAKEIPLSERVLFPHTPDEKNGMEDLRLVRFNEGNSSTYYGTFTAYDGHRIQSKMLVTQDFNEIDVHNLSGPAARGKGIALFPGKVKGKYCAIGRQDGTTLTIMYSDSPFHWESSTHLLAPSFGHDLTQIGNCGSPVETPHGWLLPTHGVGPLRRYTLGAALLDLENPGKVIGYLDIPLMEPTEYEREGYVPNVLYTCGWMKCGDEILIPYAMSDTACGFATARIDDLIDALK